MKSIFTKLFFLSLVVASSVSFAQTLIANYPLASNAADATGNNAAMTLTNAPFQNGGVFCNGVYGSCVVTTPIINNFNTNSFTVSADFLVTSITTQPVFVGGSCSRWVAFYLIDDGTVALRYNNGTLLSTTKAYALNQWQNAMISYDGTTLKLFLDNVQATSVNVQFNFGTCGVDNNFGVVNYGNGDVLNGYIKNLKVYTGTAILATEPTAQPTNLTVVDLNSTNFTYDITAAPGVTGGYLHIYKAGTAPTFIPVDGVEYIEDQVLPDGSIVAYSDNLVAGNFYDLLNPGTVYHIKIFSYNGSGTTTNYLTTAPLSATITTLSSGAAEPTNQPTGLAFTNITATSYAFSFTAAVAGTTAPDGYIGIRKIGSAPTGVPVDGTTYVFPNPIGDGETNFVGTGTTYTQSGAAPSTAYHFAIFSYKGSGASINYKQVSPLTGSVTTLSSGGPTITSFSPTSGLVGSSVTITGTGFSTTVANNLVRFNGTTATITGTPTATSITATVPTAATSGPITVVVAGQTGTSSTNFTVTTATTPTIASFSPTSGLVGASVTITGTNFSTTTANNIVRFNGTTATITGTPTATSITATVPTGATTGPITVVVAGQTGTSSTNFTVTTATTPTITSFNPASGLVGSSVTIAGTNFSTTAANNTVRFNGTIATITGTPTATSITATVPSGATTGTISVTVGGQTATSSGTFTVTTVPAPTISSFNPTSGPGGTSVTITGTNFSTTAANNTVKFNGTTATITGTPTATSIVTSVPAGATTGFITVEVSGQTATSSTSFTVTGVALATEPTAQPTNLVFSSQTSTAFTLVFTAASGPPDGYIYLRSTGSAVTGVPVDGTSYVLGDVLGNATVRSTTVTAGTNWISSQLNPSTTYHVAIFSYNGSGTSINYRQVSPLTGSTTTLSVDTTEPFVANNTTVASVAKGSPITVTVQLTDTESGIAKSTIYYSTLEDAKDDFSNFISGTMTKTTGDSYTFQIPGSAVKEMGVEYYFETTNGAGLVNYSSEYTVTVQLSGDGLNIPFNGFGNDQTKYRIISVPVQATASTANAVFGDDLGTYDKTKWRLFRYQGSTTELNGSSTLQVGNGYWLIASKSAALDTGPGTTPTVSVYVPVKLTLTPGWNQIGNPYPYDVKWQAILDWNGNPSSIAKLRTYNGNWQDGSELEKFSGGFVMNAGSSSLTLEIPTFKDPTINSGRQGTPKMEVKHPIDHSDWNLIFHLEQGGLLNTLGGLGMNDAAADGYDRYDDFNLPRFTDFIELNHLEKQLHRFSYSKDVVPFEEQHTWEFTVESNSTEAVTMKWDNSYFGKNEKQLVLWDVSQQRGFDMRSISQYIFNKSRSGHFKVYYGDEKYIKEKTAVDQVIFHDVFPNPASDKVTISFSVPTEEHVTIQVIDLLGRKVATIANRSFKPGHHEVTWNTLDDAGNVLTNGIYITQLKSLNSDQQKRLSINK